MTFEATNPGPAAMADYDQTRELAIKTLREATHGFVVTTAYLDADGDPACSYYGQINPNDRNQMTMGWAGHWYRSIISRTEHLFALAIQRGIENRQRREEENDG